jgi:hypothetical protein
MDDLTAPRIEPLGQSVDPDKQLLKKGPPRKRETPEKQAPSPSVESDDPVENIHQIDELA